jgi:outer membrane cobalamin receptor
MWVTRAAVFAGMLVPLCLLGQDAPPATPAPLKTTVTVVEKVSAETPADVTDLDATAVEESSGTNLDDRLRDVPGFTLFRRASSVVANPTTQGVSLRGIGSSGASRTLVLWDGIPANDPFGGWVYWTRFIPDEIESVEIARGDATSVFGDRAMSGAISIFSPAPEKFHLLGAYETGSENTQDMTAGWSQTWTQLAISGAARGFTTDGYYIVPESIRGAVDRPAGVRFATGDLRLDATTPLGGLFFRIDILAEERANGTWLTHNSTGFGLASLHYVKDWSHDELSLLMYGEEEGFHSTFSTVFNNRNSERETYRQTVPSQAEGGAGLWQHHQSRWNLLAGADAARVEGVDTDHLLPSGTRIGGGTQVEAGWFGQVDGVFGPVRLFAGARESLVQEPSSTDSFFSPSAGAAYTHKRLRLRTSVYRAFRAPTLNELYRSFSAGNTFTEANPALVPETVFGAEAGLDFTGETSSFRVTGYRDSLDNLITNVTLSSTATQIVRERENAAQAVSEGVEAEYRRRFGDWSAVLSFDAIQQARIDGDQSAHSDARLRGWIRPSSGCDSL